MTVETQQQVAAARYLAGLDGGEIPLVTLSRGTVFGRDPASRLEVPA